MSTAPVISPRALQELLKGNHANFVSVKVGDEIFLRVHRPVAMHFSPVWNHDLRNPNCAILTITFPPDPPPAPLASQTASNLSNGPAPFQYILPPPPPSYKNALKFVVQWMEQGGADPKGKNAVPYPRDYREGLERLVALANMLQVDELTTRLNRDLGEIPVPRPKQYSKCRKTAHPGQECETCWECHEIGHRKATCPKAHQAYLERVARREQKAERERLRLEREERNEARRKKLQEKRDRDGERDLQYKIRTGQMAVGDGGKYINC